MSSKEFSIDINTTEFANLLQEVISYAKIDSIDEVLNSINSMKNKKILQQHPYAITKNKDGRYSTYIIPNPKNAPSKRKKIVKATRNELENALLAFYNQQKEKTLPYA